MYLCPLGLPLLARVLSKGPMRPLLQNSFCACDDRTVLIVSFLLISHVSALLTVPIMFALSLQVIFFKFLMCVFVFVCVCVCVCVCMYVCMYVMYVCVYSVLFA
jgi:hypothetical protein